MAESASAQEKTEQPTPKRLRDARAKGQVPRSRELVTAAVVTAGVSAALMLGPLLGGSAAAFLRNRLSFGRADVMRSDTVVQAMAQGLADGMIWTLPFLAAGVLSGVVAPLLFGGWVFSAKALAPDPARVDPIKGLARVFSMNGLIELLKAVAKFGLLGVMVAVALWNAADIVLGLGAMDIRTGIARGLGLCMWVLLVLCGGLALIAAIDVPIQRYNFMKKMRMTKQEVRDEMKETDGRPEVKARIRQLQQEVAQRQMMQAVPTADVIVVNPRHFAVALSYKAATMSAPRLVAKGADELAATIRALAVEHRVPLVESPALARALYRHVQIGRDVPVALYTAVAQILSYVYQLRLPQTARPARPEVAVPTEFRWDPPAD